MTSHGVHIQGGWVGVRDQTFLKGRILVFFWLILILVTAVKLLRSSSWCCRIDRSGGRARPGISWMLGGPLMLGAGSRRVSRGKASSKWGHLRISSQTQLHWTVHTCWYVTSGKIVTMTLWSIWLKALLKSTNPVLVEHPASEWGSGWKSIQGGLQVGPGQSMWGEI